MMIKQYMNKNNSDYNRERIFNFMFYLDIT